MITIDKTFDDVQYSEVCLRCRHFDSREWQASGQKRCQAFAAGIPRPIWNGQNDHRQPFPGDNGIRFEAIQNA